MHDGPEYSNDGLLGWNAAEEDDDAPAVHEDLFGEEEESLPATIEDGPLEAEGPEVHEDLFGEEEGSLPATIEDGPLEAEKPEVHEDLFGEEDDPAGEVTDDPKEPADVAVEQQQPIQGVGSRRRGGRLRRRGGRKGPEGVLG